MSLKYISIFNYLDVRSFNNIYFWGFGGTLKRYLKSINNISVCLVIIFNEDIYFQMF